MTAVQRPPSAARQLRLPRAPRAPRAVARKAHTLVLGVAGVFLLLVVVAAIVPELFATHAPEATDLSRVLQWPSAQSILGTDQLGRDTFSRLVHGTRTTLVLAVTATVLGFAAGLVWGLISGLSGRLVDEVAMRSVDVLMSVPSLLMVMLVIAVFGPGEFNAAIAIAVGVAPGFARLVRAQTLVVRQSGYVAAAITLGRPWRSVVARHIAPNVVATLLVFAAMTLGQTIIVAASLSFLGLGPQPPAAEWGLMLADARSFLQRAPLLGVFPGLAITLTVVSIALLGRRLQLRFEGRSSDEQ